MAMRPWRTWCATKNLIEDCYTSEKHMAQRVKVSGRSAHRTAGIVVLVSALLLVLLVLAGNLDAPSPAVVALQPTTVPATPTIRLTPTPPVATNERLYIATRNITGSTVRVLDGNGTNIYTVAGGRDLALSPDGTTLFVLHLAELSAHDAISGAEQWRIPLRDALDSVLPEPSALLVAPHGRSVWVMIERQINGNNSPPLVLRGIQAATGAQYDVEIALADWQPQIAPFFSLGGSSIFVPTGGRSVVMRNVADGRTEYTTILPFEPASVLQSPNVSTIFALQHDEDGTFIHLLTRMSFRRRRAVPLVIAPGRRIMTPPIVAPNGQTLALRLRGPNGVVFSLPESLLIFDTASMTTTATLQLDGELSALVFGLDSNSLYGVRPARDSISDQIIRYQLPTAAPRSIITLPNERVTRLVVGPKRPLGQ